VTALGKVEAGVLEPDMAARAVADPAASHTDLGVEARYLYATVRSEDGTVYTFTRRVVVSGGPGPRRLLVRGAEAGTATLESLPLGRRTATSIGARLTSHDGELALGSRDDGAGPAFAAEVSSSELAWSETQVLDLVGGALGPGLQWRLPGMAYAGWLYDVEGTVLGRRVHGVAGVDTVWLPAGSTLNVNDPIAATGAAGIWITFATSYGPGSAEYGHLLVGHGDGVAVTCRDGVVSVDHTVSGTADPEGASASVDAPERAWDFVRDPGGTVPETAEDPMVRAEGLVRSRGEQRPPRAWMAALEIPRHPHPERQ